MPVQQYPDISAGITATIQTLTNGRYPHIVQNLRSSIPSSQWDRTAAGEVTTWGTNTAWLGSTAKAPTPNDPSTTQWWTWASGVLTGIGAPKTETNYDSLWRWTTFEKPRGAWTQYNNPLNTTQTINGSSAISGSPVVGNRTAAPSAPSDPFGLLAFGANLSKELTATVEVVAGALLMLVGLGILILMAFKIDPRSVPERIARTAVVATPEGAAVTAASSVARPAPKPLSPEAQSAVAAAKAGRGSKLSPAVKAELRGNAA